MPILFNLFIEKILEEINEQDPINIKIRGEKIKKIKKI